MTVDRPIITIVIMKVRLRPIRSPIAPKISAPSGRTAKPAPNVARLARNAALSLPGGKNKILKKTARVPYRKKSYHSKTVPSDAATMTNRALADSSELDRSATSMLDIYELLLWERC